MCTHRHPRRFGITGTDRVKHITVSDEVWIVEFRQSV